MRPLIRAILAGALAGALVTAPGGQGQPETKTHTGKGSGKTKKKAASRKKKPASAQEKSTTAKSSAPAAGTASQKAAAASRRRASSARKTAAAKKTGPVGQQRPTPERYKQIEEALAARGYLQEEPTGKWDSNSVEALRAFQADHELPPTGRLDARSLIELGLGPPQ